MHIDMYIYMLILIHICTHVYTKFLYARVFFLLYTV